MLGFETQPELYHKTTLASLNGVKVCVQQSMSNHLQFGSGQRNRPIWKKVDCIQF